MRVVRASGEGFARGTVIGKELADLIQASTAFYRRYLDARGVSSEQLHDLLTPYLAAGETAYPDAMAVLKGMSIGAMVPILELFAINAFEELEPLLGSSEGDLPQEDEGRVRPPAAEGRARADRCSSVAVRLPDTTLIAHNEQWFAGDLGNVAVVIDRPEGGRVPIASPTIVGCLPAVGLNAHGAGQGVDSVTAFDDGVGVPRVLVSRSSLDARDRADAVARAAMPGRAGGYGFVFGFADDACTVETTGRRHRVLDGAGPHTNHYLDPELAELAPPPPEGSVARLERLRELLAERRPTTPEDLMDLLRDHGSAPQAVCLHPDPTEGEEASAVMFSMVTDVAARRMWVTASNPCQSEFEEIDLTDLTA
ncbi:MAG: C45 family autoproteolytic acyltransferase/hydrolase [Actinomycetota bacterium]